MSKTITKLISQEAIRQQQTLMLIPSENYTYKEVHKAVGSILMHKYAEGQPKKRYYQGNAIVDQIEAYCEEMALKAFNLSSEEWGANVQPHSGCEANLIVYNALLKPGDKIFSMFLYDGGHLSHGWQMADKKVTLVSRIWPVQFYRVNKQTQVFDYEEIAKQAKKFRPKLIITGGTAYPREIDYAKMAKIAQSVGAYYLTDVAHEAGLIAGGANKSPFKYADVVTFTTHKTLRGPRGAVILAKKALMPLIDFSVIPGVQGGPHLHTITGIAIAFEKTLTKKFKQYAQQTVKNAKVLAQELKHYGFLVVSGGTDKHLVLLDLRNKQLNGWLVAWALEMSNIIANRNTVPYDTGSPYYPSGLRLGTPAITARGMKEKEMKLIAGWINEIVEYLGPRTVPENKEARRAYFKDFLSEIKKSLFLRKVRAKVIKLCAKYPVKNTYK